MNERLTDKRIAHGGFIEASKYDKFKKHPSVHEIYDRLSDLEDKIENGTLVELPCKVGDTVYVITNCENILMYHDNDYFTGTGAIECPFESSCDFEECNDSNLRIFKTTVKVIHCEEDFGWTFWCEHLNKDFAFSEIGTTVFLTEEEAERALAERSNQNGN